MISDVLKQMKLFKHDEIGSSPPRFTHSVLELFQFPALDATLVTVQKQLADLSPYSGSEEDLSPDIVTNFNAQVGFLPELLKSYINEEKHDDSNVRSPAAPTTQSNVAGTSNNKTVKRPKKDTRHFVCQEWIVDPKIRFIDRFKWSPPLVDDILKRLQIFDHRTTIPKVLQRGVLDQSDLLIASLLEQIVRQ
ncbi:FSA-C domain-containing protein [Aphelenchoides bicaudatus]|nr:FSA-C domain-containing protein [Aphelenchoides bicaudatus]